MTGGGGAALDDDPLRAAEDPADRLRGKRHQPGHDPRRCGEARARQPNEGDSSDGTGEAAGDPAAHRCDERRCAVCEQVRPGDGADRDERALGE